MAHSIPLPSDDDGQARRRVGAYAKLLANYASDDAIIEAGEAAELLFVRGLAFCATSDADGFITDAQVVRYVGAGMRDAMKRADRLAQSGLWQRLDGGYLVRSWTKIHETAASKGRRRKADRERKRKAADSDEPSETIPAGIQTEDAAESLSMTEQCSDTTAHDTTEQVDGPLEGGRPEPLRAVPDTEPPEDEDPPCTRHPKGNPTGESCRGCQRREEHIRKRLAREADQAARLAEAAARGCDNCDGVWVLDAEKRMTGEKCGLHTVSAHSRVSA